MLATWTRAKDKPGNALSKGMALSDNYTSLKELNLCAHGISEWDQQPSGSLKALWYLGARLQEASWQQTFKSTVAASAGMDEPTKHAHEAAESCQGSDADAQTLGLRFRVAPTGLFEEGLASKESLQRPAVSEVKDNEKDASPPGTTTAADDIIKVNESAAFLTLQRTYGTMLETQRELFDLQQRHLAKTQAIFADIERITHG
ncbi:hypothetical protein KC340_g3511 [Hortaea werneckii]|nr:hypothetical protein KC342_g469 [Hortaea werneckii]KAI7244015.1 hypothetical protein KC365_g1802 [Hortaea werneckii]KAI7332127.1 hypothetical protein KC340_g3511 [Hortaea werneckii]KAI7371118.1 hypothetical protein KC354_g777 [Hortaea werneckii]KAI7405718.1 hypothetical protein KC328_g1297 [Hortaea werneckii]